MSMSYHMIMFAVLLYDTDYYKSKIFHGLFMILMINRSILFMDSWKSYL